MIIDIPKLREDGEWFEGEEPCSVLELEDPGILLHAPLVYRVFAYSVSGRLLVKGTLRILVQLRCVRCAEFFWTTIQESSFLRAYDISKGTETVDITPDFREDILLQLPSHPLCSPTCKGLCPYCGKNLNEGACGCRPPSDGRWGALDNLRL